MRNVNAGFKPTHILSVCEAEYLSGLQQRLKRESKDVPEETLVEHRSIAKHVAMALLLTGPIHFEIAAGNYHLEKKDGKWVCRAWGTIGLGPRMASNTYFPTCYVSTKRIRADSLRVMMVKLDRYFRSGWWWHDRLGMTLEYFWNGICTSHPEQAFLSLTTAMEALLTTQSTEITHNLAERVAVLLGNTCELRLAKYRQVKKLYDTRSKIVHGKVFPKKGPLNSGTLAVGPKFSNVPPDDLKSILEITLGLIRTTFRRPSLLSIIQTKQKESKTQEQLNHYFLTQLFK